MSTVSFRLNDSEDSLIRHYAERRGLTISQFAREAMMEQIENEYDLKVYEEYLKNKGDTKLLSYEDACNLWEL